MENGMFSKTDQAYEVEKKNIEITEYIDNKLNGEVFNLKEGTYIELEDRTDTGSSGDELSNDLSGTYEIKTRAGMPCIVIDDEPMFLRDKGGNLTLVTDEYRVVVKPTPITLESIKKVFKKIRVIGSKPAAGKMSACLYITDNGLKNITWINAPLECQSPKTIREIYNIMVEQTKAQGGIKGQQTVVFAGNKP